MKHKRSLLSIVMASIMLVSLCAVCASTSVSAQQSSSANEVQNLGASLNPNPPSAPVRLAFIHHSTGEAWLTDGYGNLAIALRDNNYFVSDTNYGWGPSRPDGSAIGDHTDIGNWWEWFRGPNSTTYLNALYADSQQTFDYSRISVAPLGSNEIILFKSCFPNSALQGNPNDPIPPIASNPLCGQDASSDAHTVANAKGIYLDLLTYFQTRQDKLFIIIAAPPVSDGTYAGNARAFNQWLVNDYLKDYPYQNVFVFDYYNVLTTNGGNPNANDLNSVAGNHHRWWNSAIQHQVTGDHNVTAYATGDDHPSAAGDTKATGEFVPLLNVAYNQWKASVGVWNNWHNAGGQLLAGTGPAAYSSGGQTGVFVTGTNNRLYWSADSNGNWADLGGYLTSSPTATSSASGVIDVFVRGTDGSLYTKHYAAGSWGPWTRINGQLLAGTGPAAYSSGGQTGVFVTGTDSRLYWSADSNGVWVDLAGVLTSSPAATSPATGVIDVFVRGTDGSLYERSYT